jgi:hypothetical protein
MFWGEGIPYLSMGGTTSPFHRVTREDTDPSNTHIAKRPLENEAYALEVLFCSSAWAT